MEYLELSEESKLEQQRHAETLRKLETQKRARAIAVPTSVDEIKLKLRELGHPVTLFGEDHADRRERLREVIAGMQLSEEESARLQVSGTASFYFSPF
jgi:U4/U6 small nuclear ribonucleoprotein PRP4